MQNSHGKGDPPKGPKRRRARSELVRGDLRKISTEIALSFGM